MIHTPSFLLIWFQIHGDNRIEVWLPAASCSGESSLSAALCSGESNLSDAWCSGESIQWLLQKSSQCILQRGDVTPCCILPLHDAAGSQILPLHDAAGSQILPSGESIWQRGVKSKNFRRPPTPLKGQLLKKSPVGDLHYTSPMRIMY